MASEIFSLIYDGDEIREGEMSVADLGPALIAMGELFQAANTTLNGSQATVETKVKADFKEGSFEVLFHIHQLVTEPNAGIIPSMYVLGADKLVGQVMGKAIDKAKEKISDVAVEGLFTLFERLRGKKPKEMKYDQRKNVYILNTGDNVNISVDQPTGELYKNRRILSAAAQVASPLNRPGITKIRIERDSEEIANLQRNDFPEMTELQAVTMSETNSLGSGRQELVVRILKPSFSDGKWSVSDGSRSFGVAMEDQDFKAKVHAREVGFYDGDLYLVEMVTTQKMNNQKLSTERKIIRVISPLPTDFQEPLSLA